VQRIRTQGRCASRLASRSGPRRSRICRRHPAPNQLMWRVRRLTQARLPSMALPSPMGDCSLEANSSLCTGSMGAFPLVRPIDALPAGLGVSIENGVGS
jgi:hypothetical protein